jgi:hypothetical protein
VTATLPPVGGAGATVRVGVLTTKRLTRCVAVDVNAIGPGGIRRIAR